jgi:hypothetical protein
MNLSPRARLSLLTAAWRGSALAAAFALIGLLVVSGPTGAPALALSANTYNQMTGIGSTASAVTVKWTNGLLNSSNKPITGTSTPDDGGTELNPNADRAAATGPLSFMDSEFANLSVTVSQTENITHQGITVTWSGAEPSNRAPSFDFMQMMECYGDASSGPSPEGCEYGSPGMLGTQIPNQQVTTRTGLTCVQGSAPSTTSPPSGQQGGAAQGCDPYEPTPETPAHCDPSATGQASCGGGQFSIPFVPADDASSPLYGAGSSGDGTGTMFNQFDTNEVQAAYTATDGTGQQQFETLTQVQAPGLGCGEAESNGQTRNCWLVIVPRGSYEPNGFKSSNSVPLLTSPLSAANWAQRIQIHLDYDPLAIDCPPNVIPDAMAGTQVAYRAVTSWQTALNQAAKCSKVYSYTATTEGEATTDLQDPSAVGSAGLAFTSIPIGSEAVRDGGKAPKLPTILYAPVAVSAIDFGFNVNTGVSGQLSTPVDLTPSLLAKALTQVYKLDLPDYGDGLLGPTWVQKNPNSLIADPAFTALNPEIPASIGGAPTFPLITGDHSADNQRIWQWIQSDPATASWLDGGAAAKTDPVTADPDYVKLELGKSSATDQFDEAYTGTLTCEQAVANGGALGTGISDCGGYPNLTEPTSTSCDIPPTDTPNPASKACTALDSENLLPVETNFDQAAATVLSATDSGNTKVWDPSAKAPDGTSGWFDTVGTELPGETFMWTVNDMPDLAAYGLLSAALCNPAGADCVQPSTTNVAAALKSATKDSAGLLEVNPAKVPAGAYPLTEVVYAAVPTNQSGAFLSDYANFISYAAVHGQTAGTAPGDLPPGYLPLTSSLQTQAKAVVAELRVLAAKKGTSSSSPTGSGRSTSSGGGSQANGGGEGGGGTTGGGTTVGVNTTGTQPTAAATCTASPTEAASPTASASPHASGSPAASPSPSASPSASATAADTASGSTGCASSSPEPFTVLPPAAQAAAGTTQGTSVGSIRMVLIIILIVGLAGAVPGILLRYGRVPHRGRRPRQRPRRT